MKTAFLTVAALTLLAGCCVTAKDSVPQVVKEEQPLTLVFKSRSTVLVGGKAVQMFGTDVCPSAGKYTKVLFGPEPDEGKRACVLVSPQSTVNVMIANEEGPVWETWSVEQDGGRTMLRREDGGYVTETK